MKGRLTAWVLGGLLLSVGPAAVAQDSGHGVKKEDVKTWTTEEDGKEYEVRPATPTYFGDTGLFHISSAYTLAKGKAAFSLFRDNLDRDPKDIDFSIHGLSLAYGLTSKLELFAQIGGQNRLDLDGHFQGGFYNDLPFAGRGATSEVWETGFGDVRLGVKLGLLDDHDDDPIGLALKAGVKLGTADEAKGLGTGKTSFDGHVIVSKMLGSVADVHANAGYQVNSDPAGVNIANAVIIGGGINLPSCSIIQLQADVRYTRYGKADFEQTNPLDIVVGPALILKPGFFIRPAISWNRHFDGRGSVGEGYVTWTGRQISIGYHPGTKCHPILAPPPPPPPPTEKPNRPPTVTCEAERSTIGPGETVRCRAVGSDPDGDALTYTWSADKGKVTPNGAEATWDSTGATGTATVTVKASDGRGGTAEARCPITIREAAKPSLPCTASGFPPNRDRLNNVDKACLDDLASRLRSDPRSRALIVGHADSKEKYPEVIGRKRAEAAKAYLVKERGIDEARISVRSEAARKPADTGTTEAARKKNRRIEVYFIPEGAQVPD